jgi:hypothetical protein
VYVNCDKSIVAGIISISIYKKKDNLILFLKILLDPRVSMPILNNECRKISLKNG